MDLTLIQNLRIQIKCLTNKVTRRVTREKTKLPKLTSPPPSHHQISVPRPGRMSHGKTSQPFPKSTHQHRTHHYGRSSNTASDTTILVTYPKITTLSMLIFFLSSPQPIRYLAKDQNLQCKPKDDITRPNQRHRSRLLRLHRQNDGTLTRKCKAC